MASAIFVLGNHSFLSELEGLQRMLSRLELLSSPRWMGRYSGLIVNSSVRVVRQRAIKKDKGISYDNIWDGIICFSTISNADAFRLDGFVPTLWLRDIGLNR